MMSMYGMNQVKSKKQVEVEELAKLMRQVRKAVKGIAAVNTNQQSAVEKYLLGVESQLKVEIRVREN